MTNQWQVNVAQDLTLFINALRISNRSVRVILTVSPVPLVATASGNHVLSATVYSKSALRVAAESIIQTMHDVHYLPTYEIVTGLQAPHYFFEEDRRNVSKDAVDCVMAAFLAAYETANIRSNPSITYGSVSNPAALSNTITEFECEEVAQAVT